MVLLGLKNTESLLLPNHKIQMFLFLYAFVLAFYFTPLMCHRPLDEKPAIEERKTYLSVFSTVVTLVLVLSTRPK